MREEPSSSPAGDKFYGAFRNDYANGHPRGYESDASVDHIAIAGGWFLLSYILTKVEFVSQDYCDYPDGDILYRGHSHGVNAAAAPAF